MIRTRRRHQLAATSGTPADWRERPLAATNMISSLPHCVAASIESSEHSSPDYRQHGFDVVDKRIISPIVCPSDTITL